MVISGPGVAARASKSVWCSRGCCDAKSGLSTAAGSGVDAPGGPDPDGYAHRVVELDFSFNYTGVRRARHANR